MSEEQFDGYNCAVRIRLRVRKHGNASKKSASPEKSSRRSKKSSTRSTIDSLPLLRLPRSPAQQSLSSTSGTPINSERHDRNSRQHGQRSDSKSPFSEVSSLLSKGSSHPTSVTGSNGKFTNAEMIRVADELLNKLGTALGAASNKDSSTGSKSRASSGESNVSSSQQKGSSQYTDTSVDTLTSASSTNSAAETISKSERRKDGMIHPFTAHYYDARMSCRTPTELWGQNSTAQKPLKAPSLTGAFTVKSPSIRCLLKPNGTAPDVQLSPYKLMRSMGPPKLIDISEVFGESKTKKSKESQSKRDSYSDESTQSNDSVAFGAATVSQPSSEFSDAPNADKSIEDKASKSVPQK